MRNAAIEAIGNDGRLLRIEFLWCGDRFGHRISFVPPSGEIVPLLESIEGTPDDAWPASPALQSLSIEDRPGGRVALLVGMSGGNHWSASVEAVSGSGELRFDIACRHTNQPQWLGSRYQRLAGSTETGLIVAEEGVDVTLDNNSVIIAPNLAKEDSRTARWKFTVRLSSTAY